MKIRNLALEISSVDLKSVISQEMCQLHAQKRIRCWQKDEDNRIHHRSTIVNDSKTTSKRRITYGMSGQGSVWEMDSLPFTLVTRGTAMIQRIHKKSDMLGCRALNVRAFEWK